MTAKPPFHIRPSLSPPALPHLFTDADAAPHSKMSGFKPQLTAEKKANLLQRSSELKKPTDPTNDDNKPRLEDYIDEDFDRLQALMKVHSELLKLIVQNLVDHPLFVKVLPIAGDHIVIFEVQVEQEDVKRVIGRKGRIADALREILLSIGGKANKRYVLEIVEPKRRMDEIPTFYHHKSKKSGNNNENSVQVNLEHKRKD